MLKCSEARSTFKTGTVSLLKKLGAYKKTNGARLTSCRFVLTVCILVPLILVFGTYQVFSEGLRQVGERFKDCAICPEMIVIPGGELRVAGVSPGAEKERRILKIPRKFAISIYEITNADWENCEFWEGCKRAALYKRGEEKDFGWREWKGTRPVADVSWEESVSYAIWLSSLSKESYWLPTELEWEYAARSGLIEENPWLHVNNRSCDFANLAIHSGCTDGYRGSAPAGSYSSNRFGLYDMIGNVSEWTASCSGNMLGSAVDLGRHPVMDSFKLSKYGEEVLGCDAMVYRGGNWSSQVESFKFSARRALARGKTAETLGFRVVRLVQ